MPFKVFDFNQKPIMFKKLLGYGNIPNRVAVVLNDNKFQLLSPICGGTLAETNLIENEVRKVFKIL